MALALCAAFGPSCGNGGGDGDSSSSVSADTGTTTQTTGESTGTGNDTPVECPQGTLVDEAVCFGHAMQITSEGVVTVAVGDLDGNGSQDIVTANGETQLVVVHYVDPDGTMESPQEFVVDMNETFWPHVALPVDLDGDMDLGLLVMGDSLSHAPRTMPGVPGQGFGPTVTHEGVDPWPGAASAAVADFDADGHVDGVFAGAGGGALVSFGDGMGGLSLGPLLAAPTCQVAALPTAQRMLVARAACTEPTAELHAIEGGEWQLVQSLELGATVDALVVGEVDDDDRLDLVALGGSNVEVFFGTDDGLEGNSVSLSVGNNHRDAIVHDFTGDEIADLLLSSSSGYLSVLVGAGARAFEPEVRLDLEIPAYDLDRLDLLGDVVPDVVVVHRMDDAISILEVNR